MERKKSQSITKILYSFCTKDTKTNAFKVTYFSMLFKREKDII